MRRYLLLSIDLVWIGVAALAALLLRDNFVLSSAKLQAVLPYAAIATSIGLVVFVALGLNKGIWRFTSLGDLFRIIAAATVTIVLALCVMFSVNRLEGIARSLPLLHGAVLVLLMAGTRIAIRLLFARHSQKPVSQSRSAPHPEQVLVVGLNRVTERRHPFVRPE